MKGVLKHIFSFKNMALMVAVFLLAVTCWHALDLSHDHPEAIFGHGPGILLHGQSEKWLFALLLALVLSYWKAAGLAWADLYFEKNYLSKEENTQTSFFRPLTVAFSQGILNTKRY